jgi:hypothetical protein
LKISRDGLSRFQGTFEDQWYNHDDEYWEDQKCEVVFPIHNQYKASEVVTWNLNDK